MNHYCCNHCPRSFPTYAAFEEHVVTHHAVELLRLSPPAIKRKDLGALASLALAAALVALAAFVGGRL